MPHTRQTPAVMVRPQLQSLPRAGKDPGGSHPSSMASAAPWGSDNLPQNLLSLGQTAQSASMLKAATGQGAKGEAGLGGELVLLSLTCLPPSFPRCRRLGCSAVAHPG